ncbi:hypothetical protein RIF29_06133 [Crotalaria pallida]|uniref:Uncharacterized protein n=1 Tax=Crotalaria pallida TaxID=3830 RepID=A0AAN9J2V7_CROPI
MGKKPQKMKELSVAIAEASSTIDETVLQPQPQPPQAPRKRGRPRKIILRVESEEKKSQVIIEQPAASITTQGGIESSMEKGEVNLEVQHEGASCTRVTKQEDVQVQKGEPSRSKARRKSKPRKSS